MPRDYLDNVRVCQHCGKEMVGVGSTRKWCSHECELAHRRCVPKEKTCKPKIKPIVTKFCDDCHYFRPLGGGWRCCHYILITGHKRPCAPGAGCTVKVKTQAY